MECCHYVSIQILYVLVIYILQNRIAYNSPKQVTFCHAQYAQQIMVEYTPCNLRNRKCVTFTSHFLHYDFRWLPRVLFTTHTTRTHEVGCVCPTVKKMMITKLWQLSCDQLNQLCCTSTKCPCVIDYLQVSCI